MHTAEFLHKLPTVVMADVNYGSSRIQRYRIAGLKLTSVAADPGKINGMHPPPAGKLFYINWN
jgi:hypothetical protein